MIDLKLLERDFENVAKRLKLKGVNEDILNEIKELFKKKKELKTDLDKLLEKRNTLSRKIGELIKEGKKDEAETIKNKVSDLKTKFLKLNKKLKKLKIV